MDYVEANIQMDIFTYDGIMHDMDLIDKESHIVSISK